MGRRMRALWIGGLLGLMGQGLALAQDLEPGENHARQELVGEVVSAKEGESVTFSEEWVVNNGTINSPEQPTNREMEGGAPAETTTLPAVKNGEPESLAEGAALPLVELLGQIKALQERVSELEVKLATLMPAPNSTGSAAPLASGVDRQGDSTDNPVGNLRAKGITAKLQNYTQFYQQLWRYIEGVKGRLGMQMFTIVVVGLIVALSLLLIMLIAGYRRGRSQIRTSYPERLDGVEHHFRSDLEDIEGGDGNGAKLSLARTYIDMGQEDKARSILQVILKNGDEAEQREARTLLSQIKDIQ